MELVDVPVYVDDGERSLELFCIQYLSGTRERGLIPEALQHPAVVVQRTRMPAAPVPGVRPVSRVEQQFRVIQQTSASGFLCGYKGSEVKGVCDVPVDPAPAAPMSADDVEGYVRGLLSSDGRLSGQYAGDVEGTLFTECPIGWNLSKLDTAYQRAAAVRPAIDVEGLNGYLYFGEAFTGSPIHTEDGDLFSVNYLHAGAAKIWYFVAATDLLKTMACISEACRGTDYADSVRCPAFLRHKQFTCNARWLLDQGVQVYRIIQRPGDYVIVKPGVAHWVFNCGDNRAEAVNFALPNHYQMIAPVTINGVARYRYLTCRSGYNPRWQEHFRNRCLNGEDARVVMIARDVFRSISQMRYCRRERHRPGKQATANAKKKRGTLFTHVKSVKRQRLV